MSAPVVVRLDGVSKWYGEVLGLSDVTLSIGPGITGLLGVNGAGKSTLLKLVTGQLRPDRGAVTVLGASPWNRPALMRRIGFCPEQDNFYEEMTGAAWLAFLARLAGAGARAARARAEALLDAVGLAAEAGKRIDRYSKGMRQRLKLAQALLHDPEALFLDEPLSGTDPIVRQQLGRLLTRLAGEGRHILVSSHVLHELEPLVASIVLLHQGRLRAEGDLDEIRRFLARFPSRVQVEVDRPRALARLLLDVGCVTAVELVPPSGLLVRTDDDSALLAELTAIVAREGFEVTRVVPLDEELGAVFQRLVG